MGKSRLDPIELVLSELRDFRQEFRDERDTVSGRLGKLETDVNGAKLLGKAAMGITLSVGAFIGWSLEIAGKAITVFHR
jgi:hypothetical protein